MFIVLQYSAIVQTQNIQSIISVLNFPQDMFRLQTPGGGGFGTPEDEDENSEQRVKRRRTDPVSSHHYLQRGSVHAYQLAQESA